MPRELLAGVGDVVMRTGGERRPVARVLSLPELADLSGLSRFYLIRAFEREVGLPPHGYQLQLRLARARVLLAEGASVTTAAFEAGFADPSHFCRMYRRTYGHTPAEFVTAVRGGSGGVERERVGAHLQAWLADAQRPGPSAVGLN